MPGTRSQVLLYTMITTYPGQEKQSLSDKDEMSAQRQPHRNTSMKPESDLAGDSEQVARSIHLTGPDRTVIMKRIFSHRTQTRTERRPLLAGWDQEAERRVQPMLSQAAVV